MLEVFCLVGWSLLLFGAGVAVGIWLMWDQRQL